MTVIGALAKLLQWTPVRLLRFMCGFLTQALWLFARKERRQAFLNIDKVLGLPEHSLFAKMFAKQVLRHQVASVIESSKGILSPGTLEVLGRVELNEELKQVTRAGKGVIIVTAHLGSWELVGHTVAVGLKELGGEPFHVLAKPPKQRLLKPFIEHLRGLMGAKVLWTDRKSLLRDMLQVLKRGGGLGFVMDQKPKGRQGPVVSFMGRPTAFVSGPASLSMKTKAPVVAVFCLRRSPMSYQVYAKTLIPADHQHKNVDELTQIFSTEIEKYITLFPEQWTWNYRRWRFGNHRNALEKVEPESP